ncbi:TPA: YjaA family stress response protein [Providencia alcalifaciens]|uniref:YjaA family stress response protein n=1 Tax=Providencia TaxID=586 RepID=UPI00044E2580|nr:MULTISPECIES: YjaA family stress response protein [Providencia]ETT04632.1 hypothetical protein HMPREF1562_0258 [Providencia alcalifaciens F90-2004]EUC97033.1 hypothetical protein HMPREF1567_2676 [Providencia alcalifaciens PAL-2]MTB32365.1 hypothetical protein [Providencia alcalifaciens]MTC38996.1 hypothetical protein [Providencia alcalifaciens]MTC98783.1 hypothetical protein [Providencia alcalifaciens]
MADFYLQIRTNSMTLKNLETHEEHSATGEFSTQRMVVGDFFNAESVLYQLVCDMGLNVRRPFASRHRVLVQALEIIDGGVSLVEERLFTEMVYGAFNRRIKKVLVSRDTLPMPQRQAKALLDA